LQVLGVGLGDNLHPAGFDNPKGFWEDRDCIAINEELLDHLGSAYDRLGLSWNVNVEDTTIASLYLKAVYLVSESISKNNGVWGVKDPRMCRLLGFWKKVFDDCGCDVSYVISLRNPISVAESLKGRNGIPPEKSYFLWLQHMVPAILGSRTGARVVVDYDLLVESPMEQLIRISNRLKMPIDVKNNELLKDFSENFLEKGLRHSSYSIDQIALDDSLPSDTFKAYELLLRVARDEISIDSAEIQDGFEKIEANLQAYAAVFEYANMLEADRDAKIADRDAKIADRNAKIADRDKQVRALSQQLHEIAVSKAWRLVTILRRIRVFLLPPGSMVERFALLLIRGVRIWRNEGFMVFLHRIFLRITQSIRSRFFRFPPKTTFAPLEDDPYVPINELGVDPASVLVKTIAFYLPQFHPIPENDKWWGDGFTEWTNVKKARPNFVGHYQPHIPGELGYYDLRLPEVQKRQVELAKKYGIYGFCFYYYWFAGKRLLERPIDQYLADPALDLPFCLCWANENWTRRWDGAEHEILIGQEHNEQEYLHFIQDISPNFSDPRYIRVDGKPILLVYRINLLPDPQKAAEIWRAECKRLGIGDIYLVAVQSFGIADPLPYGFDAAVEFPPSYLGEAEVGQKSLKITNPSFTGKIFDYNHAAHIMIQKIGIGYTLFKTVMTSWDNTARRQNEANIFINATTFAYKNWLDHVVAYTTKNLPEGKRFVFINAWNEWAEGAHLEPDRHYGYAYLQATADAIHGLGNQKFPFPTGWKILFVSHDAHRGGAQTALLSTLEWFKEHTLLSIKVLCLDSGVLLPRFQALADTIILNEFQDSLNGNAEDLTDRLLDFCGWKPDLIYGNTVVAGKVYQWLHTLGVPILTHVYELEMSIQRYTADWMGDVLRYSTQYIAPSRAVKDNLIKNHAVDPNKIDVVYGAVSNEPVRRYRSDREMKQGRKKLELDAGKILVMGCGLGMPFRKGADLFIKLGDELCRRGRTDFHFYWIGGFEDSECDPLHGSWADHKTKLKKNNLGDFVTFLGYKENFKDYFQVADIFVLPSREDPLPLVAIEAAKCGLPLVCFADAGGTPDLVGDDAGFVVPFEDIEIMADKILKLMDDASLRNALGKRAREKFLLQFTVERTMPNILSTCRKVAGQKPAVSIIVPNYNHAKYLPERLESIFNQTFQDFEVILLDDASTDNSMEVLQQYAGNGNIQLHGNDQNSGSPFRQWLVGLDMARADILWIAESDDMCKPDFLENLLPVFQDPAVKLAYANSDVIDETSRVVGDYSSDMAAYLTSLSSTKWKRSYKTKADREINDALGIKNSILNVSSVLLRKFELPLDFKETLGNMHIAGDWYFYVHAIKDGRVYFDFRKLNSHRRHSNSVIAQTVSENKVRDYFREFSMVHRYIFSTYQIEAGFTEKWEDHLLQQLRDFSPGASSDFLKQYYPLDEMKTLIANAQASRDVYEKNR
jgi:glycosyltransferase involved in cell wall biosynthesis